MSESRRPDHNEVIKSEIKLFSAQKYREDAELGAFFISFTKGEGGGVVVVSDGFPFEVLP